MTAVLLKNNNCWYIHRQCWWMLDFSWAIIIQQQDSSKSQFAHKSNSKHTVNPHHCWRIKQQNEEACVLAWASFTMSQNRRTLWTPFNYPIISPQVHFYSQYYWSVMPRFSDSFFSPLLHPLGFFFLLWAGFSHAEGSARCWLKDQRTCCVYLNRKKHGSIKIELAFENKVMMLNHVAADICSFLSGCLTA